MKSVLDYLAFLFLCLVFVGGFLLLAYGEDQHERDIQGGASIIAGALLMSAALRGLTQGRRQGGE